MKILNKLGLMCLGIIPIIACKKETTLLTIKDGLTHSWKLQQQGSDVNNNGRFDTEEKNPVTDSAKITYQFKNDGSGFRVGYNNSTVDTLAWSLTNNDGLLHLAIGNKGFINNLYYKYTYSATTLILQDTSVSPSYFQYFERQD